METEPAARHRHTKRHVMHTHTHTHDRQTQTQTQTRDIHSHVTRTHARTHTHDTHVTHTRDTDLPLGRRKPLQKPPEGRHHVPPPAVITAVAIRVTAVAIRVTVVPPRVAHPAAPVHDPHLLALAQCHARRGTGERGSRDWMGCRGIV
eukprot:2467741-Rhodomonas_salina.2